MTHWLRKGLVVAGLTLLAACSKPPAPEPAPPPPPPPPPPPVIVIPPKPTPPGGATPNVVVPIVGADGVRHTILVDQVDVQRVWNFRSAWNVAALNCTAPEYADITTGYRDFLKKHAKALTVANRAVDTLFRKKYGKGYVAQRETYLTNLYNYFAYPPTLPAFCGYALNIAHEAPAVSSKELPDFAAKAFVGFAKVYEDFYAAYDKYKADLADWNAKYNTVAPMSAGPQAVSGPAPAAPAPATVKP